MNNPTSRLLVSEALSIAEIFEQVKEFDLVLTVDVALADALNNRQKKARLGIFATTPQRLARKYVKNMVEMDGRRDIFLEILNKTDLGVKATAFLLDNVINCWKENGSAEKILESEGFDKPETRAVIQILKNTNNPYSSIEKFPGLDPSTTTAVIGYEHFCELERKIIPEHHTKIDILKTNKIELPPFQIFNSREEMLQTLMDNIKKMDGRDIAVIMESGSPYDYLVRSALGTHNITFMSPVNLNKNQILRTFIKLARCGLNQRTVKVKDVKTIIRHMDNTDLKIHGDTYNELNIIQMDGEKTKEIRELLGKFHNITFKDGIKKLEDVTKKSMEKVESVVREIGMLERTISWEDLNTLEFYLNTFDITEEKNGRGVLLASPKSSTYIDRPIVFYLGMGVDWTQKIDERPWHDREKNEKNHFEKFNILIQNGERQYFMVENIRNGEYVKPCYYFNDMEGKPEHKFSEMAHELLGHEGGGHARNEGSCRGKGRGFEKKNVDCEPIEITMLSQSSLNKLVKCPRDYFFSRLVDGEDNKHFKKGNLLHDFAEFYINHKEFCTGVGVEKFVKLMVDEMRPYVDSLELKALETDFLLGSKNCIDYLGPREIGSNSMVGFKKLAQNNFFGKEFRKPVTSHLAEVSFHNNDLGSEGKVDLLLGPNHIVDHKSGKLRTIMEHIKKSRTDIIDKTYPDFQTKMYLSHLRSVSRNEKLDFTFHYILGNKVKIMKGEGGRIEENLITLGYRDLTLRDWVLLEEVFSLVSGELKKFLLKYKKMEELFDRDFYNTFFENLTGWENERELGEAVIRELPEYCEEKVGKKRKYMVVFAKRVVKAIKKLRGKVYLKSDLDEFDEFLKKNIGKVNTFLKGEFPIGDIKPKYLDNKDLVIDHG